MTEPQTRPEIRVRQDATGGPYLVIPADQLPRVREILDRNGVHYWVDAQTLSLDNKPPLGFVNFGRKGDKNTIQTVLDAAT